MKSSEGEYEYQEKCNLYVTVIYGIRKWDSEPFLKKHTRCTRNTSEDVYVRLFSLNLCITNYTSIFTANNWNAVTL